MFILIIFILMLLLCLFICKVIYSYTKEYRVEVSNGYHDSEIIFNEHKRTTNANKYKGTKITLKIINYFIFFLMSLILVLGLCDKFLGIVDYHSIVIATGSMSTKNSENTYLFENHLDNQIQVNDLIIVKKVNSLDDINLYDIICYKNEDNVQIIHRVVEKYDDYVITRGDANIPSDSMHIGIDRVVGKYQGFRIPKIGNVIFFVTSYYGMITSAAVIFLLLMYMHFKDESNKADEKRYLYLKNNYLKDNIDSFVITSKYGVVDVKNDDYSFTRIDEEDDEKNVISLLKYQDTIVELIKESEKGEDDSYEK